MIILCAVLFALILGYIRGGRIEGVVDSPRRWNGLLLSVVLVRLVVLILDSFANEFTDMIIILYVLEYLMVMTFAIVNISNLSIVIAGAGVSMNFLYYLLSNRYLNFVLDSSSATVDTLSMWLSNNFYMPAWIPLSSSFSIGDIFIAVGLFIYIVTRMKKVRRVMTISNLKRW